MPGPLHGVRIIDLTAVSHGPFATQHLADMGADVIKVEPPGGDCCAHPVARSAKNPGMGPIYMAANRNKRSLCLDLKAPEAVELREGDGENRRHLHSQQPSSSHRKARPRLRRPQSGQPSLIYAYSLEFTPVMYGHKPAFDDLVQGVSGAASLQSRVDSEPPRFIPSLIADKTTGLPSLYRRFGCPSSP